MPIIKSAMKRAKQAVVRRSRNLSVKRAVKQDISAVQEALVSGDAGEIQAKLSAAYSEIDRAVKKHTIHKNTAARRKSQLAHQVAKAAGAEATPVESKTTKGTGKKAAATKKAVVAKKPAAAKVVADKKPVAKKAAVVAKKPAVKKPAAKKVADK